jgi:MFS family permease
MGVLTGAIGFAPVVALNLAGVLMAAFGWRAVFWFSPIIGVVVIIGALMVLPQLPRSGERVPFDLPGAILAAAGLFGVLVGVSRGEAWGYTSARTLTAVAVGVAAIAAFVLWERRAHEPLIPPALLRLRSVVTANAAAAAGAVALFGLMVLLPFYMVRVLGFDPITVAGAMTPIAGSFLLLGPLGGRMMSRFAAPRLARFGYVIASLGAFSMALAAHDGRYLTLLPGLLMFAGGLATAQSPIATTAISDVPSTRMGVASSLPNISRYAGGALGTALLGVIMHAAIPAGADRGSTRAAQAVRDDIAGGFRTAALVAAAFLVTAALITIWMPGLAAQHVPDRRSRS